MKRVKGCLNSIVTNIKRLTIKYPTNTVLSVALN